MIKTNLFEPSVSRKTVGQKNNFSVIEYEKDISITPNMAETAYFASKMNVRKRQLVIGLSDSGVYVQAGEMQIMMGEIEATTGIKGAADLARKVFGSAVTGETVVKPYYRGMGTLVLEPTYRYIMLEEMADWPDGIVIEDGMFLACEDSVEMDLSGRKNLSSAIFGREGLINSMFYGKGILALESPVPQEELITVELEGDTVKIDGNMAVAWSPGLDFTVQKSTQTLVGSFVSGEGLVNVYSGTGKVLIAPVRINRGISVPDANI